MSIETGVACAANSLLRKSLPYGRGINSEESCVLRVFRCNAADYVQRWWFEPALKEAGITGYVWHCNRHTFCSWLAMSGATLKEIQELAGHKTIQMSARYAHLAPAHKLGAVERISKPATQKMRETQTEGTTAIKTATR